MDFTGGCAFHRWSPMSRNIMAVKLWIRLVPTQQYNDRFGTWGKENYATDVWKSRMSYCAYLPAQNRHLGLIYTDANYSLRTVRVSVRTNSSCKCLFTLMRANLTRESVYVTDKHYIFCQISIFLLTFRQSNDFQATNPCIRSQAGEAQEQAYPTTHWIENASIMKI